MAVSVNCILEHIQHGLMLKPSRQPSVWFYHDAASEKGTAYYIDEGKIMLEICLIVVQGVQEKLCFSQFTATPPSPTSL